MASERINEAAAEIARSRARRAREDASGVPDGWTNHDALGVGPVLADEQQFRLLVDAVEDYAVISLDPSGRVTDWNAGARRIKGYEAHEVLGRHFALFYPLEDIKRGKAQAELAEAREKGYFDEEGWRVRKGGDRFWARVKLVAVHDAAGNVRGFAKVTCDLTERQRAREMMTQLAKVEAQLAVAERARAEAEAAERRLLALISSMSDGYFTLDDSWRFAYVNPSLAKLLGVPGRDLVGQSFWEEVTDSIHSNFFRYLPGLLTGAPPVEFIERHGPTGRTFSVHAQRSEGQIVVFLRDVSSEQEPARGERHENPAADAPRDDVPG